MNAPDPRTLDNAELDARLKQLQARAFAVYERAAREAEAQPQRREAAYARAEAETAPLIAQAKALSDERVRRLRARARTWWIATAAIAIIGIAAIGLAARG